MKSIDDFVSMVRDDVGLLVTRDDLDERLDDLPGWDSVHLLALMTAVERATGRSVSFPDVLAAVSLAHIYELVGGQ